MGGGGFGGLKAERCRAKCYMYVGGGKNLGPFSMPDCIYYFMLYYSLYEATFSTFSKNDPFCVYYI